MARGIGGCLGCSRAVESGGPLHGAGVDSSERALVDCIRSAKRPLMDAGRLHQVPEECSFWPKEKCRQGESPTSIHNSGEFTGVCAPLVDSMSL